MVLVNFRAPSFRLLFRPEIRPEMHQQFPNHEIMDPSKEGNQFGSLKKHQKTAGRMTACSIPDG